MSLLEAALDYANRGCAVFPLSPGTKIPATPSGVKDATTDEAQIRTWWAFDYGIGLACGDGLFVVDVDAKAGFDSSEAARVALGLPETYTVATRNGGWHLYYRGDGPNSVGKLLPGIDTRGLGGYVVAPPTPGYEVLWNETLADVPAATLDALERPVRVDAQNAIDRRAVLQGVAEGQRQDTLFRYACSMRARGLDLREAQVLLEVAAENCDPPFSFDQAREMVNRVFSTYDEPETPENAKYGPLRAIGEFKSEPTTWLWHLRIPLGKVTVLAGVQGQGKSYLTAALAADVSQGNQLPGGVGTEGQGKPLPPSSVIIGAYEDGIGDTLRPRLESLGADLDRVHVLGFWSDRSDTPRPFRAGDIPLLEKELDSRPEVRLLILDPITSFLGGKVDGNSNEGVRDSLEPLVRLAEKYSVAVIAVAHLNKAELSAALYRVSGANAFTALPRSVLMVGRHPDTGRRGIGHVKSNLGPLADVVEFFIDDQGFRWGYRVNDLPLNDLLKNK